MAKNQLETYIQETQTNQNYIAYEMLEDKNKGSHNNKDLVFRGQNLLDQLHSDPDRKP